MTAFDPDYVRLLARLDSAGADGRAGLRAALREVEARFPGEIARVNASLQLESLGLTRTAERSD